ncbi:MAG: hypothetical protein JST47_02490 [Bacteroidetes bacterium]|nr:hypothetical protein [Bacteroidota bacterium]MBS1975527.1 hypothetical protein [Bacteroidota bacterium]
MKYYLLFLITPAAFSVAASAQTAEDLQDILKSKETVVKSGTGWLKKAFSAGHSNTDQDSFPSNPNRLLRLSGYTQVRYQHYQQQGITSGFAIRRARLDLQGNFSAKWAYRLLADFAGANGPSGSAQTGGSLISPSLFDAFISYKPFSFLKITAGQFTVPFSQENLNQDRSLETIDRSQVVSALVARKGDASNGLIDSIGNQNGRDLGLQIAGNLIKIKDWRFADYYLALLNGAGINAMDNNSSKDIAARLVVHPLKMLNIGASYYNGYDKFISTTTKSQVRTRWGFEAALNLDLISLKTEYIKGWEGNQDPIVHEGWYAQASYYLWNKRLQGVFRYDSYTPDLAKNKADNNTSVYYVFGLNYFFNVWAKLQVNYSIRTESANINNDLFSAQLQLAF